MHCRDRWIEIDLASYCAAYCDTAPKYYLPPSSSNLHPKRHMLIMCLERAGRVTGSDSCGKLIKGIGDFKVIQTGTMSKIFMHMAVFIILSVRYKLRPIKIFTHMAVLIILSVRHKLRQIKIFTYMAVLIILSVRYKLRPIKIFTHMAGLIILSVRYKLRPIKIFTHMAVVIILFKISTINGTILKSTQYDFGV